VRLLTQARVLLRPGELTDGSTVPREPRPAEPARGEAPLALVMVQPRNGPPLGIKSGIFEISGIFQAPRRISGGPRSHTLRHFVHPCNLYVTHWSTSRFGH
jgi:hypothetical protein